jgi:hypothetical protein
VKSLQAQTAAGTIAGRRLRAHTLLPGTLVTMLNPGALLFLGLSLVTSASSHAQDTVTRAAAAPRFPPVSGANLEGRHFNLPNDFEGALNVVLVAFQRQQQDDVDTWTPFLRGLAAEHADLRVYELPTLGRRYIPMRWMIDGGMRRGIPDKAVRMTTITLYIDKSPYRRALGLGDESQIYVLLVDRAGTILWRGAGRHSDALAAELAADLAGRMVAAGPR